MSTTPLEIIVTGDVKGATSGLTTVQNDLGKTALAAQKSDSALDAFGRTMQRVGTSGAQSIALLTGKLETLKADMVNVKDIDVLSKFNKQIQATENEISRLSNVGKTGFNALGDAVEKTGNPISKAFTGLRQIAYILPGIGIAGLIGLITGPLIDAFKAWYDSTNNVSEATKTLQANQANLNDILKDANKDAGKQTADLKVLYDAATNVNASMKDRLAAVNALQKVFPEFFKNIDAEIIKNGGAKDAYDAATLSIQANARAKAALSKIEALSGQQLDNDTARIKLQNQQRQNDLDNTKANLKDKRDAEERGLDQFNADYKKSKIQQQLIDNAANSKSLQTQIDFLTQFVGVTKLANAEIANLNLKDPKPPKVAKPDKEDDPFKVSLADLEDNLKDANALVFGQLNIELQNEHDFLEKKKALLELYGKYQGDNNLKIAENERKIQQENLRFLGSQIIASTLNIPNLAKDIDKESTQRIDKKVKQPAFSEDTQKAINAQLALQAALQATADLTNKILAPAFDAFFTSLLNGSGNAFQALGNALNQIVKQLAVTVLKAIALGAILAAITGKPFNIGNIVGNAIKGFAGGVKNFEGGLAVVGERGPELVNLPRGANVIPNNQISSSMTSTQLLIPAVTVRGQDLIIVLNRAQQAASRNG